MLGDLTTSKVKPIRQSDPVPGSMTFVPPGCGVKRYCPKTGSMSVMANVMPAQAVPAWPVPVADSTNTPGSAAVHAENAPSAPHDGMSVMPGSPGRAGEGVAAVADGVRIPDPPAAC